MSDTPASRVIATVLRPLASAKPPYLGGFIDTAIQQVYGAHRYAYERGDTEASGVLLLLHGELSVVSLLDLDQRLSHLEALLSRWK